MRRIVGKLFVGVGTIVLAVGVSRATVAAATPAGGIRIAPAALRLELTKGAHQATATFLVTNQYAVPITLHGTFARPQQALAGRNASQQLSLNAADITVAGGETAQETITLHDNTQLPPGSSLADLIITEQTTAGGTGVGILPAIRLPVTVVKDDGAILAFGLTSVTKPNVALRPPADITVTLRNTGNVVAIPRGYVTVSDAAGGVMAKGTLNGSSTAVAPDGTLKLQTKLIRTAPTRWPGIYRVTVSYGLGGDAAAKTASVRFIYIAWWHIAAAIAIGVAGWVGVRAAVGWHKHRKPAAKQHPPNKRPLLIGRDIT